MPSSAMNLVQVLSTNTYINASPILDCKFCYTTLSLQYSLSADIPTDTTCNLSCRCVNVSLVPSKSTDLLVVSYI